MKYYKILFRRHLKTLFHSILAVRKRTDVHIPAPPKSVQHRFLDVAFIIAAAVFLVSCAKNSTLDNISALSQTPSPTVKKTSTPKPTSKPSQTPAPVSATPLPKREKPANTEKPPLTIVEGDELLVGYYPSWARYSGFTADKIEAEAFSHIHYAFAETNGELTLFGKSLPEHLTNIKEMSKLKEKNPDLKLIISVGGDGGDKYFKYMTESEANRALFTASCVDFLAEFDYDGIDLDWEETLTLQNIKDFSALIEYMRQEFDKLTEITGKYYILSMAGWPYADKLKGFDYAKEVEYLDYIFIMGYNFNGSWNTRADFNAPLSSLYESVETYLNEGIAAEKLILGLPFYGFGLNVTNDTSGGHKQPLDKNTKSIGYISYNNVVKSYLYDNRFDEYFNEEAMSPYLYGNKMFLGYENARSIKAKTSLVKELGLAGAGVWEISQDNNSELIRSMYYELRGISPSDN